MAEDLCDYPRHRSLARPCGSQEQHIQVLLVLESELSSTLVHGNLPAQRPEHILDALHPDDCFELLLHELLEVERALTPRVLVVLPTQVLNLPRGIERIGIETTVPSRTVRVLLVLIEQACSSSSPSDCWRLPGFVSLVVIQRHPDASPSAVLVILPHPYLVEILAHVVICLVPLGLRFDLLRLQLLEGEHDPVLLRLSIRRLASDSSLQSLRGSFLPLLHRIVVRVSSLRVSCLETCSGRQEDADDLEMPPYCCEVQRAFPRRVLLVHLGLVLQQQLDQLCVAGECCEVQRSRLADLCLPVCIRSSCFQEHTHTLEAALKAGNV
mmetsp:Transcript_3240/g.7816  ORF Transcript_3240/g.7816 Transcript_3240/m.7816 type:complete len:325 (-) Transcript_3240:159-1133(-)